MSPENFCYWLQGFIELSTSHDGISPGQMAQIQEHLDLVFKKVTTPKKEPSAAPMTQEDIIRAIKDAIEKNPPYPGYTPPIPAPWNDRNGDRPWWTGPQIYCTAKDAPRSDSHVDCARGDGPTFTTTTNATGGQNHTVQASPRDPNIPIFIC